ncbi:hypothetical protein RGQ29_005379 [Quercus rubra]|uniref:Uncharacterized protein n=1 Tax=Quercus rubra TaxID=3512 RepID=A0AAN7E5C6_QUERU|nr:hypothetical protein RGQ29_005379 [Quercus rubra]
MYQHYQSTQGKLIYKVLFLQQIWNDINIGESEADKDHTLLELERQCLEVYRPKVEEAAMPRHASIVCCSRRS